MKYDEIKRNKMLVIGITVFSILVLGGVSFTFFSAAVSNSNNEKFTTQTATMSLAFDDNDNGISATLNLGESITKKFTLENTGTVDAYGKINWYNLLNTYTQNSLTWVLKQSTTENGTYTTVGIGKVPTSNQRTTAVLKDGLLVPVNTTYYYQLIITLKNLDVNQSSDLTARINSKFSLAAGEPVLGTDAITELVSGEPTNTTDVITLESPSEKCENTLAYDGTTDNNLRYVGNNPCNFVSFNNESISVVERWDVVRSDDGRSIGYNRPTNTSEADCLENLYWSDYTCAKKYVTEGGWRIIGVMNNVDDGTGNLETRIKLIRNSPLGNSITTWWNENYTPYSWDSSANNVNQGSGINDWTQADLKTELNGDFLNYNLNADTYWYNDSSNTKEAVFEHNEALGQAAQSLIGNAKWYLGGVDSYNYMPSQFYTKERGTTVWPSSGNTCNDGFCPRATTWTGKVGLIYPSDSMYSTGENFRDFCLQNAAQSSLFNSKCELNFNWIHDTATITPFSNYANNILLYQPVSEGDAYRCVETSSYLFVLPTVYLKADVKIVGGDGSPDNPYVLQ